MPGCGTRYPECAEPGRENSRFPRAAFRIPTLELKLESDLHQALIVTALAARWIVRSIDQNPRGRIAERVGRDDAVDAGKVLRIEQVLDLEKQLDALTGAHGHETRVPEVDVEHAAKPPGVALERHGSVVRDAVLVQISLIRSDVERQARVRLHDHAQLVVVQKGCS